MVSMLLCFFALGISSTTQKTEAQSGGFGTTGYTSLAGYAWSETVGWISMNCKTGGSTSNDICSTKNYKVLIDSTTGVLSGYAWSDNIGWISFNSANVAGCPSGICSPTLTATGLSGFAKVLSGGNPNSGGWSGWIDLSTITRTTATALGGYAWGGGDGVSSGVIGWTSMSGSNYGVTLDTDPVCTNGAINPTACDSCPANFTFNTTTSTCDPLVATGKFNGKPTCTIPAGSSNCKSSISWTTTNLTNAVLTDCGGGWYTTTTVGTKTYGPPGVTIPFNSGCYELHKETISGQLLDTVDGTSVCASGSTWNGTICSGDPATNDSSLDNNHTSKASINVICHNSTGYSVTRTEDPLSDGTYAFTPVNVVYATPRTINTTLDITEEGNYKVICLPGDIPSVPAVFNYDKDPLPTAVSLHASPSTIQKGSQTVISWNIRDIITPNSCTLKADPVCSNNSCTPDQTDAVAVVNEAIKTTAVTDSNDPNGAERKMSLALNKKGSDATQAKGQKTVTLQKTTDFILKCNSGVIESSQKIRVNVTKSNEG